MSWQVATVLITSIAGIIVAVIKFAPKRLAPSTPRNVVSEREFVQLQTRVDVGFKVLQESLSEIKTDVRALKNASRI